MDYAITIEEVQHVPVLAIQTETTIADIGTVMGPAYGELYGYIAERGVAPTGPPTAVYSKVDEDGAVEVEICVPVSSPVDGRGRIVSDELSDATVITTLHRGPYEKLAEAYEALEEYARSHGLEVAGPMREEYLNGPPDTPPERFETRISWPVQQAA